MAKDDLIGYRFGGTEEEYLVPVREAADKVEAQRQREWLQQHPGATDWALGMDKCVRTDHPDGRELLAEV